MVELFPEGFEEVEVVGGVELAAFTPADWDSRLTDLGAVAVEPVAPGWEEAWKRFHRPARIGPLWVGPPWERPDDGAIAVVIDPGRAFGTGAHPTTRLCLDHLLTCGTGSLVDLGCGSGVVAIAAAKLGFSPVIALDDDEAAVEAAHTNAAANEVAVEVRAADVVEDPLPEADLAVANLDLATVERVAERVSARRLVTSGYLVSDRPSAATWRHRERRTAEGWAADLFDTDRRDAA
jgi:ribosomal protein L11 methyltransferase